MSKTIGVQFRALRTLCTAIFGRNNLNGTDFDDIRVCQSEQGLMVQFRLSNDALGKILDKDVVAARGILETEDCCQSDAGSRP